MGYLETIRAIHKAHDPEVKPYTLKAQRDVPLMLANQPPPAGEDYGHWTPQMAPLLQAFEQEGSWGVQQQLARMLYEGEAEAKVFLGEAVTPNGRPWREVVEELEEEMQAKEQRAIAERQMAERKTAAERRMAERLARTTGDSMADEIMAMLREQDLSRTDIYRHYGRNVTAERINDALFVLERLGWARWRMVSTGGRGREVWYLPPDEE